MRAVTQLREIHLADRWQVSDRIEILASRDDSRLSDADITTNLGFVRPFDAAFLARLKPTVAIPLMWETWEYREQDLDLASCRRLQIPVLGTNEHHPALKTIDYVGAIALKLLCELDIEPIDGRVGIIGSGDFATAVERVLSSLGTKTFRISPADEELADESRLQLLSADALVIVEHHNRRTLIGQGGVLDEDELREMNAGLAVAHICGGVNRDILRARGFRCAPERFAEPGYMSVATDYIGPRPLIDLHTAGFKVGAVLASHVRSGLRGFDAEVATLATTDLAQGFAGYHPAPGQLAQKVLS